MADHIVDFTRIFLGLFLEAAPFLLMGTLASGLVEVFVRREDLLRFIPHNPFSGAVMGGVMGFVFPVCECGVVPLTQRLFRKGMPVSVGIAFLMAAPIINPITLASTYTAYGFNDIFFGRFALGLTIPVLIGLMFSLNNSPAMILLPSSQAPIGGGSGEIIKEKLIQLPAEPLATKLQRALKIAGDEFFEMGKYLIAGAMIAAAMQTFLFQGEDQNLRESLREFGAHPVLSILAMQLLAFIMSICSTVDAIISLAFVQTFTTGSIIAFLVFGPMVDIKSTMMFLNVFKPRIVAYLVLLPLLLTAVAGILLNLFVV